MLAGRQAVWGYARRRIRRHLRREPYRTVPERRQVQLLCIVETVAEQLLRLRYLAVVHRMPHHVTHEPRGDGGSRQRLAFRSRAAPGKSGLHAHGEGELVITLESWEAARQFSSVAQ